MDSIGYGFLLDCLQGSKKLKELHICDMNLDQQSLETICNKLLNIKKKSKIVENFIDKSLKVFNISNNSDKNLDWSELLSIVIEKTCVEDLKF